MNRHRDNDPNAWVLTGKLGPPRQRVAASIRHTLLDRLEQARNLPLTLITAPAGFGKSTLLAQWHQRLTGENKAHVAWLTLDEDDGEISRFVAYLVLAVSAAGIDVGPLLQTAQAQLHEIDAKSAIAALIRHIRAAPLPLVMILDDGDRIASEAVDHLLRDLIKHADPRLNVILSGRERPSLPVSDFIVQGMALCMDARDMALSFEEATHMFGNQLSPQTLRQIYDHTEGWAVALQLAALWISSGTAEDTPISNHLLEGFSRSPRGIASWLTEQVLARLDSTQRNFLLRTSILDRFDAALADAVLESTDSARQLNHLTALDGLLIALDAGQQRFRYHHLFAEVLRAQLQCQNPLEIPDLHRRAALWLNDHEDLLEAVKHAIHADDLHLATGFIAQAGGWALILEKGIGYVRPLLRHFTLEQIQNDPVLNITQAYLHIKIGQYDKAQQLLDRYAEFPSVQKTVCQSGYITVRALLDSYLDIIWTNRLRIEQIKTQIGALGENELVDATLHCVCVSGELGHGNIGAALHHAQAALDNMRRIGNVVGTAYAMFHLGQSYFHAGQLDQAEAIYRKSLLIADDYFGVDSALKGYGRCMLAQVLYWRDEMVAARSMIEDGLPFLDGHDVWLDVSASAFEASLGLIRHHQDTQATLARLEVFAHEASARSLPRLRAQIHGWRLDVLLDQPSLQAASQEVSAHGHESALEYALQHPHYWSQQMALGLPMARWQARLGRTGVALALLQRLEMACLAGQRTFHLIRVRASLALLLHQRGELEQALTVFGEVLDYVEAQHAWQVPLVLGRPARTLFHLVQQRDPLARAGNPRSHTVRVLLNKLQGDKADDGTFSPREQDILQEVCCGHANKHIARSLNMSENTVKFHLKNIFRKLGVTNRTSAIAAVHARKLLR